MRRFFTVFLFVLLTLPFVVSAQDQTPAWELSADTHIDVTDLGFRFYYPVGWVWGNGSNGIVIAETQADLDAQIDDDDDTQAEGLTMTIVGIPVEAVPAADEPRDISDYADFLLQAGEITVTERFELPVLSRRGVWVVGENSQERSGVATIWTQNGYLILANMGGPDKDTISNLVFSWAFTVANMEPIPTEPLGAGVLTSDVSQFTMNYPDTWTADPNQPDVIVYELADDIGQEITAVQGINLSVIDAPLADMGLDADADVETIATTMAANFGLDDTATHEEFIFLGQPATVSSGAIDDGSGGKRGLILTSSVVGENVVIFVLLAPSAERAAEFMPTWVRMMQTVTSTAPVAS